MSNLIDKIRASVVGANACIDTPFGQRPLIYADFTASGRALDFIENYIQTSVLPWYANTHTETSFTGAQTTALREQSRQQIHTAVNGSPSHKVIFCGSGATAAVGKLIDIMNLRLPEDLASRYQLQQCIPASERPVVFVGPYEHHSNELPWRESIAEVVSIPLNESGQINLQSLDEALSTYAARPLLIGSFSAASNVTGVKTDVAAVTALLKRHGALAFWDYAAAAPYVAIDMQGKHALDAVFISPHKFIGGPGTPGVLVVEENLLKNAVPAVVGGGTVTYVSATRHQYTADPESREEGGTPAIVESIRAGLVFKLQQEVGTQEIERLEQDFTQRAISRLANCPNVEILGPTEIPRLSIMSLRFQHLGKDLHYGFVVSLFNDLFGIQMRGGCSCAGPYAHVLLGMEHEYSRAIEKQVCLGNSLMRPGWVRLNFNYFIDESEFEYLLRAIELVATYGWRLLPYYQYDHQSGTWRYQGEERRLVSNLQDWSFQEPPLAPATTTISTTLLADLCVEAEDILTNVEPAGELFELYLNEESERLRWFLLPQEAATGLEDSHRKQHHKQYGQQSWKTSPGIAPSLTMVRDRSLPDLL